MSKSFVVQMLAALAAGGILYSCGSFLRAMNPSRPEESVAVTAELVSREFEADSVAATVRLKGKLIAIEGTLADKRVSGNYADLELVGRTRNVSLRDVNLKKAAALKIGSLVRSECVLGSGDSAGGVTFKDCEVL